MGSRRIAIAVLSTAIAVGACGSSKSSANAFCDIVKKTNADPSLDNLFSNDTPPSAESIAKMQKSYQDLAASAPADIKAQVQELSDFVNSADFTDLVMTMRDQAKIAAMTPEEQKAVLDKLQPVTDKIKALSATGEAVDARSLKDCGVKLGE
jgi:hypothetical protein